MVLVLELTSTRLYAYIGSTHATSIALSIAMLGAGIGAFLRLRFSHALQADRAACGLAAGLFCLASAATAGMSLPVLVSVSLVPFALAGALVADAYAARGSTAARATYAFDLLAAAGGCLVAPQVLGPLAPTEIIALLGLLGCVLALVMSARPRRRTIFAAVVTALAHASLLVAGRAGYLPDGPLAAMMRSARSSDEQKAIADTHTSSDHVLDAAWSPLGRLDVHQAGDEREERLGVFTD
ncbi:MAG TPA: hypothetical protein VK427_17850, partial [Kofleriaceae bacterium]|nr:hypothetical protein [Kofleriaceae bacterium]